MQNYEVLKLQGSQTSNMQATGLLESKRISVFKCNSIKRCGKCMQFDFTTFR